MNDSLSKLAKQYGARIDLSLQKMRYSLRRRFSHSGEQQILADYIERLVPNDDKRMVVDIGAGNGVRWSNSYALVLAGWRALGIEADAGKYKLLSRVYDRFPRASACHARAELSSIVILLKHFDVPRDFSVLCLDIDGNDFWILNEILGSFRPRLIVTEINEKIPPPIRFVVKYDAEFRLRHHFYGYSIQMLADLCARHNYGILTLEYNNAFIAPRELGAPFVDADQAYRQGYRDRPERKKRFALNFDVEEVLAMKPQDAVVFLQDFYAREEGKYFLGLDPLNVSDAPGESVAAG